MSDLVLELHARPGSSIDGASHQACTMASDLGVTIRFAFNGVTCIACPGDRPERLVEAWNAAMDGKAPYRVARAAP
jgi:hypothetical protein